MKENKDIIFKLDEKECTIDLPKDSKFTFHSYHAYNFILKSCAYINTGDLLGLCCVYTTVGGLPEDIYNLNIHCEETIEFKDVISETNCIKLFPCSNKMDYYVSHKDILSGKWDSFVKMKI